MDGFLAKEWSSRASLTAPEAFCRENHNIHNTQSGFIYQCGHGTTLIIGQQVCNSVLHWGVDKEILCTVIVVCSAVLIPCSLEESSCMCIKINF